MGDAAKGETATRRGKATAHSKISGPPVTWMVPAADLFFPNKKSEAVRGRSRIQ